LDYLISLAHEADLRVGLEIRPSLEELTAPDNLGAFVQFAKHLAERYDGDTDFGIGTPGLTDQMPYPDINGSFGITTSDWQNATETDLQAFADSHKVAFFTVGAGLSLKGDDLEAHAAWIAAISAGLAQANPDTKLWIGPLRLSEMKKSALQTLTAPIFENADSAFAGFLVDLDLQVTDLGAEDVRTAVKILTNIIGTLGGDNIDLVVSGMQIPNTPAANESPWIRPCDVTVSCTPEIQSDLLIKSSIRIRGLGYGVGLSEAVVIQDNETALGPLASLSSNKWDSERPDVNLAGRSWRQWQTFRGGFADATAEIAAPAQNVSAYILGDGDINSGRVVWYEWYREAPPGSSYSGIEKTVELPAPEGALQATFYQIPDETDENAGSFEGEISLTPVKTQIVSEAGTVSIVLQDRIMLITFSAEAATPVEADVQNSDDTTSSDATPSADVTAPGDSEGSDSGGGGGCQSASIPVPGPLAFLFLLGLWALRMRRNALHS